MFLKLTKQFGKPVCVLLYAVFGWLAGRKKPLPLLILLGMHLSEYFLVGRKAAEEAGLKEPEGFFQCLAFGFTWWLPIKKRGCLKRQPEKRENNGSRPLKKGRLSA